MSNDEMENAMQPSGSNPRLWAAREVCRHLGGISSVTLWRRMQNDDFPAAIRIAGRLYFRADEIDEYIRQAEQAVAPEHPMASAIGFAAQEGGGKRQPSSAGR